MISPEILQLNNQFFGYSIAVGYFFIFNPNNKKASNFQTCRELFHNRFKNTNKFIGFFSDSVNDNYSKISQFWDRREESLNIPENERTVIYKTNYSKVVVFKLSPFWLKDSTARSLLTLLIRLSCNYYVNNFQEAINKYDLARNSQDAIKWYFKGNVNPTYRNLSYGGQPGGFAYKFKDRNQEYLEKNLTRPPI